VFLVHKRERKR